MFVFYKVMSLTYKLVSFCSNDCSMGGYIILYMLPYYFESEVTKES